MLPYTAAVHVAMLRLWSTVNAFTACTVQPLGFIHASGPDCTLSPSLQSNNRHKTDIWDFPAIDTSQCPWVPSQSLEQGLLQLCVQLA
jgi:hypothetical protein